MKALHSLLAGLALLGAAPAPAPSIPIGLVLDDTLGKTVKGWFHAQGTMFSVSKTKDGVTTSELDCCIAVFTRAKSYIVARTEPLARNATGGVIKEKVVAVRRIDTRPGELEMVCSLYSLQTAISLKNRKTNMVRSIVVDEGALGLLEWKDSEGRCGIEGD